MKITDEDKKAIYTAYISWCNQVADDLEDKTWFTAEELVGKVLSLTEELVVKEILAENDKLKEINEKLSARLSWKCKCPGCFQVK